jgi:signal transduction histidine kinase
MGSLRGRVSALRGRIRRPEPVLFVILALLCASVLVFYLQHRAITSLRRQTDLVSQQISQNAANRLAQEIRRSFEGPVFSTLSAVNLPLLSAGRLDLVAGHFANGLKDYTHVERFFIWENVTHDLVPNEVIFFGGEPRSPDIQHLALRIAGNPVAGFYRDAEAGRAIFRQAQAKMKSQLIYAAMEENFRGAKSDVMIRMVWVDANRDRLFAILGYVVNHDRFKSAGLQGIYQRRLAPLLKGDPRLEMRVLDENGTVVFSSGESVPKLTARSRFQLLFYPSEELENRMASVVPVRRWTVLVSPAGSSAPTLASWSAGQAYGLSALSIALIFIALFFAVKGNQRAGQLERMQSDFISHVSHQLKTPLSLLSAAVETVGMDRVRSLEKQSQYLEIMRTETARLSTLVERVLEFSRVQAQGRRYEPERLSLAPLVRETVEAFQRSLALDGFRIRIDDQSETPVVFADPVAIEQVLVNLLDNAVKYSDGMKKEVSVRVAQTAAEATISVTDNGIGIAVADRHRIFDRFVRGPGAHLNRQGFGLGLAIARELVDAHRGRIDVVSAPGAGSTFTVRLPLVPRGQLEAVAASEQAAPSAATRA